MKKLVSFVVIFAMCCTLALSFPLPASAANSVSNETELKFALADVDPNITINGDFTITQRIVVGLNKNISSGGTHTITIAAGGELVIDALPQLSSVNILNRGTITVNSGGSLKLYSNLENHGTINNDGTIENNGTFSNSGAIENNGTFYNSSTIENNGTFNNSGTIENNGTFNNSSTINNTGDLANFATFVSSGTINNTSPGTIRNMFGTFSNSGTIDNAVAPGPGGTIYIGGGTFDNSGTIYIVSPFDVIGTITGNPVLVRPFIDTASPSLIHWGGGSVIDISGVGFDGLTSVTLNGVPAQIISSDSNNIQIKSDAKGTPGALALIEITTSSGTTQYDSVFYGQEAAVLEGAQSRMDLNSPQNMSVRFDGELYNLSNVRFGEDELEIVPDPADQNRRLLQDSQFSIVGEVSMGSTIITLYGSYLAGFGEGTFSLKTAFLAGPSPPDSFGLATITNFRSSASAGTAGSGNPKTGDETPVGLLLMLIAVAGAGIAVGIRQSRKSQLF